MVSESVLKVQAVNLLIKAFGVLDTERFITSIKSANFDYTEWQRDLWKDKTIGEIHEAASAFAARKNADCRPPAAAGD